jgi:hypothetical protein
MPSLRTRRLPATCHADHPMPPTRTTAPGEERGDCMDSPAKWYGVRQDSPTPAVDPVAQALRGGLHRDRSLDCDAKSAAVDASACSCATRRARPHDRQERRRTRRKDFTTAPLQRGRFARRTGHARRVRLGSATPLGPRFGRVGTMSARSAGGVAAAAFAAQVLGRLAIVRSGAGRGLLLATVARRWHRTPPAGKMKSSHGART